MQAVVQTVKRATINGGPGLVLFTDQSSERDDGIELPSDPIKENDNSMITAKTASSFISADEIRTEVSGGSLIKGGDIKNAAYASYRFRPAKVFHGDERGVVDLVGPDAKSHDTISPGEFVWVRMQEIVELPSNMMASWWQTHSLSQQGLLLMNMSVVEPGYFGPLSCLFVNFSRSEIPVTSTTPMAKLVFGQLVGEDTGERRGNRDTPEGIEKYDYEILKNSLSRPSEFLRVTELEQQVQLKAKQALDDQVRDLPTRLLTAAGIGALLIVMLAGVEYVMDKVVAPVSPDVSRAVDLKLDELQKNAEENRQLKEEIEQLKARLEQLEGDEQESR